MALTFYGKRIHILMIWKERLVQCKWHYTQSYHISILLSIINMLNLYWLTAVAHIWEIWYIFSREYVQSFYLRANLSISGERCSVTATIPAHKINRRLAMTPTTKLTPRIWFPSWLKNKIFTLLLCIGVLYCLYERW